jgi:hypothetical protein
MFSRIVLQDGLVRDPGVSENELDPWFGGGHLPENISIPKEGKSLVVTADEN